MSDGFETPDILLSGDVAILACCNISLLCRRMTLKALVRWWRQMMEDLFLDSITDHSRRHTEKYFTQNNDWSILKRVNDQNNYIIINRDKNQKTKVEKWNILFYLVLQAAGKERFAIENQSCIKQSAQKRIFKLCQPKYMAHIIWGICNIRFQRPCHMAHVI